MYLNLQERTIISFRPFKIKQHWQTQRKEEKKTLTDLMYLHFQRHVLIRNSVIFKVLVPVVQRVNNAIQRISIGKTNYAIRWIVLSTL